MNFVWCLGLVICSVLALNIKRSFQNFSMRPGSGLRFPPYRIRLKQEGILTKNTHKKRFLSTWRSSNCLLDDGAPHLITWGEPGLALLFSCFSALSAAEKNRKLWNKIPGTWTGRADQPRWGPDLRFPSQLWSWLHQTQHATSAHTGAYNEATLLLQKQKCIFKLTELF